LITGQAVRPPPASVDRVGPRGDPGSDGPSAGTRVTNKAVVETER
jgi:hypothetical protein